MVDPASSNLKVPADLEQAGARLNQMADAITEKLVDLKKRLAPLDETWQDEARERYRHLQNEWDSAADGLFGVNDSVLSAISRTLNVAWDNYSECEWANIRTWTPGR
ncbi:WXG100 family type VII secretion target [Mangrovihabitans endophyticus]|uniref:WXG100 family type VII secretion target n=1 Tax=Mangrovihabitans endophyticus TaxID=1751298 RepID=A0A8J3FME3_9ACTN|nr:WXG100 family type VII secretion target [Mangrovihabitans endophyticus]GGK78771.1 hypothetical protein GCM10012284_10850 [Mangrovihabitans endophyticus]